MTTIVVEDGSQVPNANSYVSLADAITYHTNNGNTDFTAADEATQTAALLQACQSMELLYGPNYLGNVSPLSPQGLLHPRMYYKTNTGRLIFPYMIAPNVVQAQLEIALMQIQGVDIFPIRSTTQNVKSETTKLGELSTSTAYSRSNEGEQFPGFRKIDLILAPVIRNNKTQGVRIGL